MLKTEITARGVTKHRTTQYICFSQFIEDLFFFCLIHEPVEEGKSCIKKKTKSLMSSSLFHMPEHQRVLSAFLLTFAELWIES